jgi:hypothetical protein
MQIYFLASVSFTHQQNIDRSEVRGNISVYVFTLSQILIDITSLIAEGGLKIQD